MLFCQSNPLLYKDGADFCSIESWMRRKKVVSMDLLLAFGIFAAAIVGCISAGIPLCAALLFDWRHFFGVGLHRGFSAKSLFKMVYRSRKTSFIVCQVLFFYWLLNGIMARQRHHRFLCILRHPVDYAPLVSANRLFIIGGLVLCAGLQLWHSRHCRCDADYAGSQRQ